jgi:hypothetical protein
MAYRRPRYPDDLLLPPGVQPWNPDAPVMRRGPLRPPLPPPSYPVAPVGYEPQPIVIDAGPAPLVTGSRTVRPRRVPLLPGEELEAEQQYGTALQNFEPQKRGWKKRLAFAGLQALAALGGGPGAALGAGAASLGLTAADPALPDKYWRARELGQSEERLGDLRQQRRAGIQDDYMQSQAVENLAQAEAALRPKAPKLVEQVLPDGTSVLVPEAQGVVTGRPRAPKPTVAIDVDGKRLEVDPEAALGYYGAIGKRDETQETRAAEREAQRLAAQDELDQLTTDEVAAGEEKNRAYSYLEKAKANYAALASAPADTVSNERLSAAENEVREATRAAETANSFYRSFGSKKITAKAKVDRYGSRPASPTATAGRYTGQRFSRAKVAQRAQSLGMTVEQAEQEITRNGGTLY